MNKTILVIISLLCGAVIGFGVSNAFGHSDKGMENYHATTGHSMEDMMSHMNAGLVGKTGSTFDQAFLEQMIIHHEGAVEMAELALESSERQEIRDLATAIVETQTTEINQMKDWQMSWK